MIMQRDTLGLNRLLREGASVLEADTHGWTPLHWATSGGSAILTHMILREIKAERDGTLYYSIVGIEATIPERLLEYVTFVEPRR